MKTIFFALSACFFSAFLSGGCKKEDTAAYPFSRHAQVPADATFHTFIAGPQGKMLALTLSGSVWVIDEQSCDSIQALSAYKFVSGCVNGDTLFAQAYNGTEKRILQFDFNSNQILSDEPAPSVSLDCGGIHRSPSGHLYLTYHKDVSFFISGYSDLYHRFPDGSWESVRVYRDNSNIINFGGAIGRLAQDAAGDIWFGTGKKGLGQLVGDSIVYHKIPFQQNTWIDGIAAGSDGTFYLQANNLPYAFRNGIYSTVYSSFQESDLSRLYPVGMAQKNLNMYYLYDHGIYKYNVSANSTQLFELEELVNEATFSHGSIGCGACDSKGFIWIWVRDEGVYFSNKI